MIGMKTSKVIILVLLVIKCTYSDLTVANDKTSNELFNEEINDDYQIDMNIFKIKYNFFTQLFYSTCGSILIGLSGIMPLLLIDNNASEFLKTKEGQISLNRWLCFAFGSIIGDVFLHLLPETYQTPNVNLLKIGCFVLLGFVLFFVIEKIFVEKSVENETTDLSISKHKNGTHTKDDIVKQSEIEIEGYLNLFANFIDNVTHGLAVGSSFVISTKIGILTTMCILIHEIPHEVSDFVILLRAGFNRWRAAKWQLITSTGSVIGAVFAISVDTSTADISKQYILPLTSGAFLYIAMVSLLPSIMKEDDPKESSIQIVLISLGLGVMWLMSSCC